MNLDLKHSVFTQINLKFNSEQGLQSLVREHPNPISPKKLLFRKLADMKLLQSVPFHYIVPHPDMIQPESIKFFYLDHNWLNALVDGAYSIGRYATKEAEGSRSVQSSIHMATDGIYGEPLQTNAMLKAIQHRNHMLQLNNEYLEKEFEFSASPPTSHLISGFILRSRAVSHWKGIQVNAYDKGKTPESASPKTNEIFRFERIDEEMLFCMFIGDFVQLDIHQPSHGLHFGFDKDGSGFKKILRDKNGKMYADGTSVPVPFRGNAAKRVVNLAQLAKTIGSHLKPEDKPDYLEQNQALLSSDFALQMVEGVGKVSFTKS